LAVGIVSEIVMLRVEFIIMQESTALTTILCSVDVFILRIPLYDTCYPLLLGFFWIWQIRYSLKADFLAYQITKLQAFPSHFAEKMCTSSILRPTMYSLFHYSLPFEELRLHVENGMERPDFRQIVLCFA